MIGNSMEPHVSAAQWAKPEMKSAVIIPHKAAITIALKFSSFIRMSMNNILTDIRAMQK